jgi:hypothetical protein
MVRENLIYMYPVKHCWWHITFCMYFEVDSIGFWRWCITHRITGVSDFIHRPDFNNYKKKEQTRRFGNWSVSVLRWGETPILLGHLERANLNHWTTLSGTLSYINTCDQVESMRANKKKCNKNRHNKHRNNLKQGLLDKSKLAQHAYEEVIKLTGTKLGFWILKATAGLGNTRKRPIWLARTIRLANPA